MKVYLRLRHLGGSRVERAGRTACDTRGAELFEMALMLPVLLMLLIGMVWMGRAFNLYQTLTRATREGARAATAPSCATCGNGFPNDSVVEGVVKDVLSAASVDVTNPSLTISINRDQVLNPGDPIKYQISGVIVTVVYPIDLIIPFTPLNAQTISISSTARMRQEY